MLELMRQSIQHFIVVISILYTYTYVKVSSSNIKLAIFGYIEN